MATLLDDILGDVSNVPRGTSDIVGQEAAQEVAQPTTSLFDDIMSAQPTADTEAELDLALDDLFFNQSEDKAFADRFKSPDQIRDEALFTQEALRESRRAEGIEATRTMRGAGLDPLTGPTGPLITEEEFAREFEGGFGLRADGKTQKGPGHLGVLTLKGGGVATEYTAQSDAVRVNGQRIDFPTLVPGLSGEQIKQMADDIIPNRKPPPDDIMQIAVDFALKRLQEGKSVFKEGQRTGATRFKDLLPGQQFEIESQVRQQLGEKLPALETVRPDLLFTAAATATPRVVGDIARGIRLTTSSGAQPGLWELIAKKAGYSLPKQWFEDVEAAMNGPLWGDVTDSANRWIATVGQQLPIFASAIGSSALGGPMGGIGAMSSMEASVFYESARRAGLDHDLARKYALFYGPPSGAIEYAQMLWPGKAFTAAGKLAPNTKSLVQKALKEFAGAAGEGLEEFSQNSLQNFFLGKAIEEHNARNPGAPPLETPDLTAGGLESFIVGAGVGGILRGGARGVRGAFDISASTLRYAQNKFRRASSTQAEWQPNMQGPPFDVNNPQRGQVTPLGNRVEQVAADGRIRVLTSRGVEVVTPEQYASPEAKAHQAAQDKRRAESKVEVKPETPPKTLQDAIDRLLATGEPIPPNLAPAEGFVYSPEIGFIGLKPVAPEVAPKPTTPVAPSEAAVQPEVAPEAAEAAVAPPVEGEAVAPAVQPVTPTEQVVAPEAQVVAPTEAEQAAQAQQVTPEAQVPATEGVAPEGAPVAQQVEVVAPLPEAAAAAEQVAPTVEQVTAPKVEAVPAAEQAPAAKARQDIVSGPISGDKSGQVQSIDFASELQASEWAKKNRDKIVKESLRTRLRKTTRQPRSLFKVKDGAGIQRPDAWYINPEGSVVFVPGTDDASGMRGPFTKQKAAQLAKKDAKKPKAKKAKKTVKQTIAKKKAAPKKKAVSKKAKKPKKKVSEVVAKKKPKVAKKAVKKKAPKKVSEIAPKKAEAKPVEPTKPKGFKADPTVEGPAETRKGGFIRLPGGEKRPAKGPAKPFLTTDKTSSPDKGIDEFFGRTNKLLSVKNRFRKVVDAVKVGLTERFKFLPFIPNTPEGAFAKDAIRTMPEEARGAQDKAIKDMLKIVQGDGTRQELDPAGLDLLRRKVFVEDLISEAEKAEQELANSLIQNPDLPKAEQERQLIRRLPEGVRKDALLAERKRIDELIAKVPSVADAFKLRQGLWREVSDDLVARGVITEEAAKNSSYVRHFVLDFVEGKRPGVGAGKRLKKPFRGYAITRKGTRRDISTDYLEVELKALADIYRDNAIEDLAQGVAERYDQSDRLAKEAASRGMTVETLASLEGLAPWQYDRGNMMFKAKTITDAKLAQMMDDLADDPAAAKALKIPVGMLQDAMVVGGKRKTFFVPEWLVNQLNDLPIRHRQGTVVSFTTPVGQAWKRWILRVNPIRYNSRNAVGDGERVLGAGRTKAFLRVPEALKMLIDHKSPDAHPQAVEKMLQLGVAGSSLWHEMGAATKLPEFEKFQKITNRKGWNKVVRTLKWPLRKASRVGQVAQDWTQNREDLLRIAVYLDVLDEVDQFRKTGKPIRHWIGNEAQVRELAKTDKYRAAAKISRETLGDYGAFTPWENDTLRNGLILFYSWLRINTVFWPKAIAGAIREEGGKAATKTALRVGARGVFGMAKWSAKIGTAYAALAAWNYGDEDRRKKEKALPVWIKARPHVILDDGIVHTPSALSDFLEWFDLEEVGVDMRRFEQGQITYDELLLQAAKTTSRAPVNKIVQSLNPFLKTPITLLGTKTFPDIFESRTFAKAFSSKAVERAVLDILGADVKRFVQAGKGTRTLDDVMTYYVTGSAYNPMTADELEAQINKSLDFSTLKVRSKKTGRKAGDPKKGREREAQDLQNRLEALGGTRKRTLTEADKKRRRRKLKGTRGKTRGRRRSGR